MLSRLLNTLGGTFGEAARPMSARMDATAEPTSVVKEPMLFAGFVSPNARIAPAGYPLHHNAHWMMVTTFLFTVKPTPIVPNFEARVDIVVGPNVSDVV